MIFIIMEPITGQIKDNIQDNGKKIKCMDKVKYNGQMENHMKGSIKMIKSMAREYFNGQMEIDMLDLGLMGNKRD